MSAHHTLRLTGRRTVAATLALLTTVGAAVAGAQPLPAAALAVYAGVAAPRPGVAVTVTPASATVAPGATQAFTATPVATSNTMVVWSATGGTVSAAGVFTAGPASGRFAVTATLRGGTIARTVPVTVETAATGVDIYPGEDIQARVDATPAGSTFRLRAGTHRFQSITPRDGDTFIGEAGTVLSGARPLTVFTRAGAAWVASDQTQQGDPSGTVADDVCWVTHPRCGYPEDLFVNDVALQHVASLADGGPGRWYFDYDADQIYLWDDPTGQRVDTSVTPQAFGGTATGVTLRGLVIEKYAAPTQHAAVVLGVGWILEDAEVRFNHAVGVWSSERAIARRNTVHHNGCFGFQGAGEHLLIEDNEIAYNGVAGYSPYWGAGGSKWVWTTSLVVRGNRSHHNFGPGLWTDINNIYTVYEDNVVEDNARGGIFHEISYQATIRRNTLRRNGTNRAFPWWTTGAGIEVVGSSDVEVYENILEDNWQGITGLDDHRGTGNHGLYALINLHVHNNEVISRLPDAGTGRTGMIDTATGAFTPAANNRFDQNHYLLGTSPRYFIGPAGDQTDAEWRAGGFDVGGTIER